jgi:acetyl-CoA carboxylase biotin carboxyl carrier protein
MTLEEIKELIQVVQESGVAELEVQRGENRVRIRRAIQPTAQEIVYAGAPAPILANVAPGAMSDVRTAGAPPPAPPTDEEADLQYIKSPIVGTFYESPSPGTPAFVKVGDHVASGQVVCIIESMKLMNEIESEFSGVVVRKLLDNGKPVEYGQALFAVKPA